MFYRPPDLPTLRQREMTDDGPYIGSNLHNGVMMWLYGLLRQLEPGGDASWRVANLLDLDVPWTDGRVDRLRADIMIYPIFIDPNLEALDLGKAGPPTLVLELADIADAKEWAADADLTEAKAAWYAAIGVREYLVFDLEAALRQRGPVIWARRMRPQGGDLHTWWEPWEPDARGRWVSKALGLAFAPVGVDLAVSLRVWDARDRPLPTEAEWHEMLRRQHDEDAREARAVIDEARLTLLRARHMTNEDDVI